MAQKTLATKSEPVASTSASVKQEGRDVHLSDERAVSGVRSSRPKGWMHFVAGGFGGMCGAIVTSPLDVVKTRLQSDMYVDRSSIKTKRIAASASTSAGSKITSAQGFKGFVQHSRRLAYHFVETGQLLREISVREGPKALFRGLGPTLVGVIPARSINFYTYGNGKLFLAEHLNNGKESPQVHLLAAITAGLITATATNPIWVVKTRLQLQQHEAKRAEVNSSISNRSVANNVQTRAFSSASLSSSSAASSPFKAYPSLVQLSTSSFSTHAGPTSRSATYALIDSNRSFFRSKPKPVRPGLNSLQMTMKILQSEGVPGLYKGLSASYLGAAEGTIQWVLYEQLKRIDLRFADQQRTRSFNEKKRNDGLASTVGAAGTAKMVASLITYPHEVLRTRLRQQPPPGQPRKYNGLLQTAKLVLREEGISSFYGGLSAHLLRVVPNAAIMFVVYETMLGLSE